jgi:hypothetical protein
MESKYAYHAADILYIYEGSSNETHSRFALGED